MAAPVFFPKPEPLSIAAIVEETGVAIEPEADATATVTGVAPLETARPGDLTFLENAAYAAKAAITRATACFVAPKFKDRLPPGTIALVSNEPYKAYARIAARLFPTAAKPQSLFGSTAISPGAYIHAEARLEEHVVVDPGAVIGAGAQIGSRSVIGPGAVIGPGVTVGRGSAIGAGVTIQFAMLGNRVIVHPGVRIGQDGFGFAMGPGGHLKVPQLGRVVIQDDVEIGANTTIDRGTTRDTVIGEGTKIDNLVQIGHNAVIGRHCVIVSQVGISGSSTLQDYVVVAGQVGIAGHVTIGMAAQIGAQSGVMSDLAAGGRYLGSPAKPARQTMREVAALAKLAAHGKE